MSKTNGKSFNRIRLWFKNNGEEFREAMEKYVHVVEESDDEDSDSGSSSDDSSSDDESDSDSDSDSTTLTTLTTPTHRRANLTRRLGFIERKLLRRGRR